ncbi:MAG: hypothetical protein HDQ88_10935 [Clostridia bacterium]|nr:hypothetical protein [Clostridia bacterium]
MDKNFSKFKKQVWLFILIKCLLAGLAGLAIAVNAVFLPCKFCGVSLFWPFYILIGLGGFLIAGGVAFLLLRTDDRKISKMLDTELGLQERVQTAYECQGSTGGIYDLQRKNASFALKNSAKSIPFKNVVATVLCALIFVTGMVSVPVVSAFVADPPEHTEEPDDPGKEPPRDISDWEWLALDDLIDYVKTKSKADATAKAGMLEELEGLKNVLLLGVSQSSLKTFVQTTVMNIRNAVVDANDISESEQQKAINTQEGDYVVKRLYEIFNLSDVGEGNPDGGDDGDNGDDDDDDENNPTNPGDENGGGQSWNDAPFFDKDKGKVDIGEVIGKYNSDMQEAFNGENGLSEEEWWDIMVTYFQNLTKNQ